MYRNCRGRWAATRVVAMLMAIMDPLVAADADLAAAQRLYAAKRYPEARAALEEIVATEPQNAAACHLLGLTFRLRGDERAFTDALVWLEKAMTLEPANARYLGDFGGTALQVASVSRSLSAATRGRDAMERAVRIDPGYLEAREGLYQFYERAPWPLGSNARAAAHLAEIRKRDPDRATVLSVMSRANAKEYAAAFKLCETVLQSHPDNYAALYHYGRTASLSGQNLDRGLACLERCLALEPPGPAAPTHSHAWQRIGSIQLQRNRPDLARQAYERALKLEPTNHAAATALEKMN